jgi:uncharacterized protein YciI
MFVIISKYLKKLQEIDEEHSAHAHFLEGYYRSGRFLASGRMNPALGEIILARGESREEMENIFRRDPLAIRECAEYEVLEFDPNPKPLRAEELEEFLRTGIHFEAEH